MNWHVNSPTGHPPCQTPCVVRTRDGRELRAQLIHLNENYHGKIPKDKLYKWRLGKHSFVEDDEVVEWRYAIDI